MKVRNRRRLRSREDMIGWRAKRGKLWEKTVENQRSRATRRAAGSPVRRSIGKRAPTAPPQVSAGHKRITDTLPTAGPGAPRATSTCRLRAPNLRSASGPAGPCGSAADHGHFPFALLSAHTGRSRHCLPEGSRQGQTPSREKKEAQAFLVKTRLYWGRRGCLARAARFPTRSPGSGPRAPSAVPPPRCPGPRAALTSSRGSGCRAATPGS